MLNNKLMLKDVNKNQQQLSNYSNYNNLYIRLIWVKFINFSDRILSRGKSMKIKIMIKFGLNWIKYLYFSNIFFIILIIIFNFSRNFIVRILSFRNKILCL